MQLRINQNMDAGNVSFIYVKTRDAESSAAATREATTILRETHRLSARQPNDFTVTKQEDLVSMANSITSVFTIFLSGIAGNFAFGRWNRIYEHHACLGNRAYPRNWSA